MKPITRYNIFSMFYDLTTEPIHCEHREEATRLLDLQADQVVLDVPCGTGANFPSLNAAVGPNGRIIGCDYSAGMLAKAQTKIDRAGWRHVTLVETDARMITRELLEIQSVDAVLSMLGMTVIPDWESVFERTYDLLRPGGRYVIMDLFLEGKRTSRVADRYYRMIAGADSTRRFWEPLEARALDYEAHEYPWFGGTALIVAGTKPAGLVEP